jgi:hypothetical protein
MPREQWIAAVVLSLGLLLATIQLVRKRKLREEYALLWLASSAGIFVLAVFPWTGNAVAALFKVAHPSLFMLAIGLLFALSILLSHSMIITGLADHRRDLAQTVSILEWRVQQLERKLAQSSKAELDEEVRAEFPNASNHIKSSGMTELPQPTRGYQHSEVEVSAVGSTQAPERGVRAPR